jgi:glutamate carboxypeptidase
MTDVYAYLKANQDELLADLKPLVRAESPSLDKRLTDLCGGVLQELSAIGSALRHSFFRRSM